MDAADQVFVSDAGTSLKKADIAAIAKYIVENYVSSTIGGSAQSVQAAIGALNSRCQFTYNMKHLKIALYGTSFTVFLYNDDAQQNGFSISVGANLFSLYKIEAGGSSLLWDLRQ